MHNHVSVVFCIGRAILHLLGEVRISCVSVLFVPLTRRRPLCTEQRFGHLSAQPRIVQSFAQISSILIVQLDLIEESILQDVRQMTLWETHGHCDHVALKASRCQPCSLVKLFLRIFLLVGTCKCPLLRNSVCDMCKTRSLFVTTLDCGSLYTPDLLAPFERVRLSRLIRFVHLLNLLRILRNLRLFWLLRLLRIHSILRMIGQIVVFEVIHHAASGCNIPNDLLESIWASHLFELVIRRVHGLHGYRKSVLLLGDGIIVTTFAHLENRILSSARNADPCTFWHFCKCGHHRLDLLPRRNNYRIGCCCKMSCPSVLELHLSKRSSGGFRFSCTQLHSDERCNLLCTRYIATESQVRSYILSVLVCGKRSERLEYLCCVLQLSSFLAERPENIPVSALCSFYSFDSGLTYLCLFPSGLSACCIGACLYELSCCRLSWQVRNFCAVPSVNHC